MDSGRLEVLNTGNSIFIGDDAGYNNANGTHNIAIGREALTTLYGGTGNIAIGDITMRVSTEGSANVALGVSSLVAVDTGTNNTAIGAYALSTLKSGEGNTAVGKGADVGSVNANNATAIGANALVDCDNCLVLGAINGINGAYNNTNVGIGTTLPDTTLHVVGKFKYEDGTQVDGYILTSDSNGVASWQPTSNVSSLVDADGDTRIQVEASPDEDYIRFDVAGNEAMVIDNSGKVGIGLPNPSGTFQVKMDPDSIATLDQENNSSSSYLSSSGSRWQSFTAGITGELAKIEIPLQTATTGTKFIKIYEGEGTNGNLLFTGDTITLSGINTAIFPISDVNVEVGNIYTIWVDNMTNARISSSNPYPYGMYNNDPDKDIRFRTYVNQFYGGFMVSASAVSINNYALPQWDGSSGQVMTTDGAGTVSWQAPNTGADDQVLSISNDTIYLEDGGFVILPNTDTIWAMSSTGGISSLNASNVASGYYSLAAGLADTATGYFSVAFGDSNFVSGIGGFVAGWGNRIGQTGSAGFGSHNTVTNSSSFVAGKYNTLSGGQSAAFGSNNTLSSANTFAAGDNNTITSSSSASFGANNHIGAPASFAVGLENRITGYACFVSGGKDTINASYAAGFGRQLYITGDYTFAAGRSDTVSGNYGASFGQGNNVSGNHSFAAGNSNVVSGGSSIAIGSNNDADGFSTIAFGDENTTSEDYAVAIGFKNSASGYSSMGLGRHNYAPSYGEIAIGTYNLSYTPISATSWDSSDRIFSIGNGSDDVSRSNALTILKNGNMGIGTTTPVVNLDLYTADTLITGRVYNNNGNGISRFYVGSNNGGQISLIANASSSSIFGIPTGCTGIAAQSKDMVFSTGTGGNNSTEKMRLDTDGDLGLGTSDPTAKFHIVQSSDTRTGGLRLVSVAQSSEWDIFARDQVNVNGSPQNTITLARNGVNIANLGGNGVWYTASDERYKNHIMPIGSTLSKVMLLKPSTYYYTHQGENAPLSYGFIAQEVEQIFPDFVMTDDDGMKSIAYDNFGIVAIKAIQDQQDIINAQQEQLQLQQQQLELQNDAIQQLQLRLQKLEDQ